MYIKFAALGAALIALSAPAAQALPAAAVAATPDVTLVADDCGVGRWRGPEGHCHPDRERIVVNPVAPLIGGPAVVVEEPRRACPLGMHLGPHGHDCFPN